MASERSAIGPTVERILAATRSAGLTDDQRENLAMAAAEALSNAAVHGNGLRRRRKVQVSVSVVHDREAVVEIRDSGGGFDVAGLRDPTAPSRILAPRGRGVFLMRHLVDDVEFNAKGNGVRLTLRRKPL